VSTSLNKLHHICHMLSVFLLHSLLVLLSVLLVSEYVAHLFCSTTIIVSICNW
jgi:hypothetical protein